MREPDPNDLGDSDSNESDPPLKTTQKVRRWKEENKLQNLLGEGLSAFDRAIHKQEPALEFYYLQKTTVRESFSYIYHEYDSTPGELVAVTVGEITQAIDYSQSTVSKAIKNLGEAPVIVRVPHPSPERPNVIGPVPPILNHVKTGWEMFEENVEIPNPPRNSRAEGIIAAYERHACPNDPWEANNNIELWIRGELMGIVPDTDLNIQVSKGSDGRGLLDIRVEPTSKECLPAETWNDIKSHAKAMAHGFASLIGYEPDTGEYLSPIEAKKCVMTPNSCLGKDVQNQRLIIDFLDTEH